MNPLRIKASGSPATSANFQGLQVMSDAEIKNYIANKVTTAFASAASNGSNTADINIDTANALSGTSIGTFVDTDRTEATGTHPATGATATVTYYAKQVNSSATESITARAIGYDSATGAMRQLTNSQLSTDILDKVITAMVTESDYTAGQYRLSGSAPSGGTWTSRYTITDVANGGNTTYYIWQKTAATSAGNADYRPMKASGNNVTAMTDAEINQMEANFRNRIIASGVGTYKLQASTPSTGTWVNMGSASDTREQVASQNYTGSYSGTRTYSTTYGGDRTYSTSYGNTFAGTRTYSNAGYGGTRTYSDSYQNTYAGTRSYSGTRTYSKSYTNSFAGSRTYSGSYGGTRTYSDNYARYYGGYLNNTFGGSRTYTANYTGSRTYSTSYANSFAGSRTYSGSYVSATQYFQNSYAGSRTYTGSYAGSRTYSGTYANSFAGSRTYSANYAGSRTYSGSYSGTYAGDTIKATKDVVSTVSLWVRTA